MAIITKQRQAARKNIQKAQARWRGMTQRQHSLAQPQGRARKRPGTGKGGRFYRIEVRPKSKFVTFRTQDVGRRGGLERVAGRRGSGSWDTATWLVAKEDAHIRGDRLIIDDLKAKTALKQIRGPIKHKQGDIFTAKPTMAMRHARLPNIRK